MNVPPVFIQSFAPEMRYFFLTYTKYACEKLPFSGVKSSAEFSPSIYVVLPYVWHLFLPNYVVLPLFIFLSYYSEVELLAVRLLLFAIPAIHRISSLVKAPVSSTTVP